MTVRFASRAAGLGLELLLPWILIATTVRAATGESDPTVPRETIILFNGKDLAPFYSWIPRFGHSDPDRVFTVVDQIDGAPAIRVSGQHYGGLVTQKKYANYRLVAEYRWGNLAWAPRTTRARDSGILLHCQGAPSNGRNKTFQGPRLRSVEFQLIDRGTRR